MLRTTWENMQKRPLLFAYGAFTLYGGSFQILQLRSGFLTFPPVSTPERMLPATSRRQRMEALTPARFRLFPFRSPLLGESLLISFPQGTEMFQFPWFASPAFAWDSRTLLREDCSIRKSPDLCLLDNSPGLIAASHVLHRLMAPRHPPNALSSLTSKI